MALHKAMRAKYDQERANLNERYKIALGRRFGPSILDAE